MSINIDKIQSFVHYNWHCGYKLSSFYGRVCLNKLNIISLWEFDFHLSKFILWLWMFILLYIIIWVYFSEHSISTKYIRRHTILILLLKENLKFLTSSIEFPQDIFSLFSLRLALVILLPPKGTWFGIKTTTNKFPQNAFSGGYSISSFLKLGNFVSQVRGLPPRQSGCGAVGSAKVFNDIEIPAWKNIKIFLKNLLT